MKIGTIGTGNIVKEILKCVAMLEQSSCEAVYSRSFDTGKSLADSFHVETVYTSLNDLMQDNRIDTIYIASPNSLHFEQAKMALEHGKHVLLEKPMTATVSQAQYLFHLAEQNDCFLLEAITNQSLPNFHIARRLLPEIGRVKIVQCSYSQYSSRYDALLRGEIANVFNPTFEGGALADLNIYNIYFVLGLFGVPKHTAYYPNRHENGVDLSGIAILEYPDFICSCEAAKDTWGDNCAQIQGEQGFITVKDGCNWISQVTLETKTNRQIINEQTEEKHWFYHLRDFERIIQEQNREEYQRRKRHSLAVVDTLQKARLSAGIQYPVDLQPLV